MSLPKRFFRQADRLKDRPALLYKRAAGGAWETLSWSDLSARIRVLAAHLVSSGLEKGDKVAILSENRPEWAIADLAVLSAGGVTVPLYFTSTSAQIDHILKDSGTQFIIVSTAEQLVKLSKTEAARSLKQIIVMDDGASPEGMETLPLNGILAASPNPAAAEEVEKRLSALSEDDIASIIYTSGTTGLPKGVVLTHGNFLSNAIACTRAVDIGEGDLFLSFLPLSHAFERTVGYYVPILSGATIAYAESIDKIPKNMKEIKPTVIIAVPRFYEKTYAAIIDRVKASSSWKGKLFEWGVRTGRNRLKTDAPSLCLSLHYWLAGRLIFNKLKAGMGGRLRFFISGGAPLSTEIADFFSAVGLTIIEGYGLTETSPVITCNTLNNKKGGSVGKPLLGVEVKIADDGEIATRGPHIMRGYYNRPELTDEMLREGWLYTGDIGELDDEGFLTITDRKKEIIVTAGGKNVAPQAIETALATDPLISQVMAYGDRKKFISALIVPDKDKLRELLDSEFTGDLGSEQVENLFAGRIEEKLADFASFERVKKFILINEEFSMERGEVTPTLKLNRKKIIERFGARLDALYED